MPNALRAALSSIASPRSLGLDQVLNLRRALYADGRIDAAEVRALLHLHHNAGSAISSDAWGDLFVEAISDFYAIQREVPDWGAEYKPDIAGAFGHLAATILPIERKVGGERTFAWSGVTADLSEEDASALVTAFQAEAGYVLDALERRVLSRLFDRAVSMPESLRRFALKAVYETVRHDGRIDAEEVVLLRRILYGPSGPAGIAISREEAELLFAVKRAAEDGETAPEWRDFFVKAVTSHVLFAGATPEVVDAAEAVWLMAKLGSPEAMDPVGQALIGYVMHEAQGLDPRLEPYRAALRAA